MLCRIALALGRPINNSLEPNILLLFLDFLVPEVLGLASLDLDVLGFASLDLDVLGFASLDVDVLGLVTLVVCVVNFAIVSKCDSCEL